MENITMTTTTGTMPAVGMSGHGSAYRTTGASWAERARFGAQVTDIARGAVAGAFVVAACTAVLIDAVPATKGAFPGPDAWSPPIR